MPGNIPANYSGEIPTSRPEPMVTFTLPLGRAERLAWIARWPARHQAGDAAIAAAIDQAIRTARAGA